MAVFGGMIASSVVKEVIGKLASPVWEQIGLHWDFKDDMDDMMENLEMIQCVLVDAEEKSLTDKAVCLWLKKLKSAAYDIEDMMCDFETKIPSNKEGGLGGWLQQIKHSAMMGKKRVDLVEQMKKMRKRLSNIAARRSQFVFSIGNSFNKESVVKERETFSTVNENTILGRDDEKVVLMRRLKQSNDGENAFIIAIVGIGGIGKTSRAVNL